MSDWKYFGNPEGEFRSVSLSVFAFGSPAGHDRASWGRGREEGGPRSNTRTPTDRGRPNFNSRESANSRIYSSSFQPQKTTTTRFPALWNMQIRTTWRGFLYWVTWQNATNETETRLSKVRSGHCISRCLISLHFLCCILFRHPVRRIKVREYGVIWNWHTGVKLKSSKYRTSNQYTQFP